MLLYLKVSGLTGILLVLSHMSCQASYGMCRLPQELNTSHYFIEGQVIGHDSVMREDERGQYYMPVITVKVKRIYHGLKEYKVMKIYLGDGVPNFCIASRLPVVVSAKSRLTAWPMRATMTCIGLWNHTNPSNSILIDDCYHLLSHQGSLRKLVPYSMAQFYTQRAEAKRLYEQKEYWARDGNQVEGRNAWAALRAYQEEMKRFNIKRVPMRLQFYLTQLEIKQASTNTQRIKLIESMLWYRSGEHDVIAYLEDSTIDLLVKEEIIKKYNRIHDL